MKKRQKKKSSFLTRYRFFTIFSVILLGVILALTLIMRISIERNKIVLNTETTKVSAAEDMSKTLPTFIRIPDLTIARVVRQTAKTTERGYAIFQYIPSDNKESKATILYGGKSDESFGRLKVLQEGDPIYLLTQDGTMHEYHVESSISISLSALEKMDDSALYLTTQTLFPFQKRVAIKAQKVE